MNYQKIKNLKNQIAQNIVREHTLKLEDVLSFCESEIESLLVLELYNFFANSRMSFLNSFEMEFILDEIVFSDAEDFELKNRIEKYKYHCTDYCYQKYIGFRAKSTFAKWVMFGSYIDEDKFREKISKGEAYYASQEFEIFPQYSFDMEGKSYRIDIAIILKLIKHSKIVTSKKIALECDGYDYHSSPDQKKSDDKRSRKLKLNGWSEIFRYSGSEISGFREQDLREVFDEIEKMFYVK